MYLKFSKLRDVKSPNRANVTDAGIDFYIPNDFPQTTLVSHESALIPSGIKIEIPFGYAGIFMNKSGVAAKKKLLVGAQVVDQFYCGEVHLDLHNVGEDAVILNPGDKIVQLVLVPVSSCVPFEVNEDDLYKEMKESVTRTTGGFGSTGTK